MAVKRSWRVCGGLLMSAAFAGVAGCTGSAGHPAAASAAATQASGSGTFSAAELRGALLTHVNGVVAAAPATSGEYASLLATHSGTGAVQVVPAVCAGAVTAGFSVPALAGSTAAKVTFKVGANGVSEMLISASAKSASTALAGHVPAQCTRYRETAQGKTLTYSVKEVSVTGIGRQAKVLNAHADGNAAGELWSLIYRGAGFVGTVTVIGANASEEAVRELGQQAYAFAAKSLA